LDDGDWAERDGEGSLDGDVVVSRVKLGVEYNDPEEIDDWTLRGCVAVGSLESARSTSPCVSREVANTQESPLCAIEHVVCADDAYLAPQQNLDLICH
jgi:hypothetical protein